MTNPAKLAYATKACAGPCFYRGTFTTASAADTFLDTSAFVKGFVWVNRDLLGRVWDIGPQRMLHLPGPWLRNGRNEVIDFDLQCVAKPVLEGRDKPILDTSPTPTAE